MGDAPLWSPLLRQAPLRAPPPSLRGYLSNLPPPSLRPVRGQRAIPSPQSPPPRITEMPAPQARIPRRRRRGVQNALSAQRRRRRRRRARGVGPPRAERGFGCRRHRRPGHRAGGAAAQPPPATRPVSRDPYRDDEFARPVPRDLFRVACAS
jgi:hypothetical protein